MILASLVFLMSSVALAEAGESSPRGSIERIVVVLGENDPVTSSRVLERMKSCTDRIPTAVVSAFGALRVAQDFSTEVGSLSLAARLPQEKTGAGRSFAASLELLAEALTPVGPTTAVVLISPHLMPASDLGYDAVTIPRAVIEARDELRKSGLTLVAVNTSGQYEAAAKALTEIPRGRYLRASQRKFPEALVAAVCPTGR